MTKSSAVLLAAAVAGWLTVTAATAPQPVSYDLAHEDTGDYACWVEKATSQDTAEAICGPRGLRPAGSVDLGAEVVIDGRSWVATLSGLEPVSSN